jgi:hypothetical protein
VLLVLRRRCWHRIVGCYRGILHAVQRSVTRHNRTGTYLPVSLRYRVQEVHPARHPGIQVRDPRRGRLAIASLRITSAHGPSAGKGIPAPCFAADICSKKLVHLCIGYHCTGYSSSSSSFTVFCSACTFVSAVWNCALGR